MYENAFNNIERTLRAEEGISNELDYVEQTSWVLFLKYLHDLEAERQDWSNDIRARLGRILGRDVERGQAERENGVSDPGHESRSIRERLQNVLARDRQVVREEPGYDREESMHRHQERDHGDEWEL